ncbi:MAG: hypothetical protein HYZ15_04045 [Sphingobacteriales bacterium]|nr:hypothetical protein [Sphingobacteriales bacterium]
MAQILLTYDIKKTSDTIHTEVKKELVENYGYSPKIQSSEGKWYELPNTCLIKNNTSRQQASADFLAACQKVRAKWEKYIAVEYSGATFNNQ